MLVTRTRTRIGLAVIALMAGVACAHAGSAVDSARAFLLAKAGTLGTDPVVSIRKSAATLPACQNPQPFLPGHGQRLLGRITVGVRCNGHHVRYLQARVDVTGSYWVAAQPIAAGSIIKKAMLKARKGSLADLPRQAVRERASALGKVTTRSLSRGTIVLSSQLKTPALVHHSRKVTVEAVGKGFRVTSQGKALQDGGMGATVRVRMANREVLTGVVSGKNTVEVSY